MGHRRVHRCGCSTASYWYKASSSGAWKRSILTVGVAKAQIGCLPLGAMLLPLGD